MRGALRIPLCIVSLYALFGALWIYSSDSILQKLVSSADEIAYWSIWKGWLYVAATTALLFWLIYRQTQKLLTAQERMKREHTELKRTQASLATSEEQFRQMFAKHQAIQYLIDPKTLAIFEANHAAQQFYGYSAEQFKKLTFSDLTLLEEEEISGLISRTDNNGNCSHTFKHRLANGELRDVEVYSTPIRLNDRSFHFAIVHDITERKHTEDALLASDNALRESEARFRSLVEATSDWIWELDANDHYVYTSPKVREFLGYEPMEILGKTPFELMPEEEANRVRLQYLKIKEQKKPFFGLENRNRHKNGRIVMLETSGVPVKDQQGNVVGYRGIDRNVTDRKHLEEQLTQSQKMEAIGQLAGGVAHDFNNILTAITGYVFILEMKLEDSTLRKHVEQIRLASERAAGLIDGLLAFSRKQIICLKPLQINEIILKTKKMLARLIREDIEIRMDLTDENLSVLGDESKIEQIIINLVTNARDAMPGGGIITVSTERCMMNQDYGTSAYSDSLNGYVLLSVADTGVGIDEENRERIFEPFFTTKEVGKGTGLGLAIVYGIVKQLNGYIDIQSEPGIGTSINILLPLIKSTSDEAAFVQVAVPKGGAETLLVAEDDPDVRRFIRTVLEEFGYTIIEAVDGKDAVAKYHENSARINGIILDVIMPKMNGRDAYREIKSANPDIKAVFLSGYTGEFLSGEGIIEEGLNFLPKPVVPWRLLEKVREVMSGSDSAYH